VKTTVCYYDFPFKVLVTNVLYVIKKHSVVVIHYGLLINKLRCVTQTATLRYKIYKFILNECNIVTDNSSQRIKFRRDAKLICLNIAKREIRIHFKLVRRRVGDLLCFRYKINFPFYYFGLDVPILLTIIVKNTTLAFILRS